MKLFRKNSHKDDDVNDRFTPGRLTLWLDQKKRYTADFLSQQMERLPTTGKRIVVLVFGVIMCSATVLVVVRSFSASHQNENVAPKPSDHAKPLIEDYTGNLISHGDYELLVGFRKTLDSLRLHDPMIYQNLLRERQGLIDSLDFLIKIYNSQGKALLNH